MAQNDKAAVFVLLGQSNAVGHGIPMEEKDKILTPLKNVFGLSREKNQSFENDNLCWDGYVSFGMNLAEEQDNTYSVANYLAKQWQKAVDEGKDLPDLYIVHIAIGAQGVTEGYMWNPGYEKKLIPGKLGTVNISLFPFTLGILSLVRKSLCEKGKTISNIKIHWRGGENDTTASDEFLQENLEKIYNEIFDGFNDALGEKVPVVLHKIVCRDRFFDMDPSGVSFERMNYINKVFSELSEKRENTTIFDVSRYPSYIPDVRGNGIFIGDAVHYTPEVNCWVAEQIMNSFSECQ